MNIKKDDKVQVLAGKDKGKNGKVLQVFPKLGRASVEGINIAIKHLRPRRQGEKGQRIEFPAPINMSNLILICDKCSRPTRVAHKFIEVVKEGKKSKKKVRVCKKCNEVI